MGPSGQLARGSKSADIEGGRAGEQAGAVDRTEPCRDRLSRAGASSSPGCREDGPILISDRACEAWSNRRSQSAALRPLRA